METNLMTVEDIAAKLNLKRSWIYSHADQLGVYRLGKYLRFSWPSVLECLTRNGRSLGEAQSDLSQPIANVKPVTGREQDGNKPVA